MRNHGLIVLIDRPIDDIMLDIRAEKRPFLAQKAVRKSERIYNERMPIYKSAADVVMDNGNGFHNGPGLPGGDRPAVCVINKQAPAFSEADSVRLNPPLPCRKQAGSPLE